MVILSALMENGNNCEFLLNIGCKTDKKKKSEYN